MGDDKARAALDAADPARAQEILEELDAKGPEIRNPSAFVSKAVQQFSQARGRAAPASQLNVDLQGSPGYDALDDKARAALDAADPARAQEILEELDAKGSEIRNPSAFVSRSLQQFPQSR